jgi:hypothetical protein
VHTAQSTVFSLFSEFFRHRERFLVTSLHTPPSSEKEGRAASLLLRVLPPGGAGSDGGLPSPAGFHLAAAVRSETVNSILISSLET